MNKQHPTSAQMAAAITKAASLQTYHTIHFFVDRDRVADAYRAYGYFRWVDDIVDDGGNPKAERVAFAKRQKSLLEACYRREKLELLYPEEEMLTDMVARDEETNSGLQIYLRNMMDVMLFDVERRGQVISQAQLSDYTNKLAKAVTEALYHFIGHDTPTPACNSRYLAVTGAHITHMLRDGLEDVESGYFNIPREVLGTRGIAPQDTTSPAYRAWVCERVQLARRYFQIGRECTAQVRHWRCRLAGYAYIARFEWMLNIIARDNYCLKAAYPERKSAQAGLWMGWSALTSMFGASFGKGWRVANPGLDWKK